MRRALTRPFNTAMFSFFFFSAVVVIVVVVIFVAVVVAILQLILDFPFRSVRASLTTCLRLVTIPLYNNISSRGRIIAVFFLHFVEVFASSRSFGDSRDGVTAQFFIPHRCRRRRRRRHRRRHRDRSSTRVRQKDDPVYICIIARALAFVTCHLHAGKIFHRRIKGTRLEIVMDEHHTLPSSSFSRFLLFCY